MKKKNGFVVSTRSVGIVTIIISIVFAVLSFSWVYQDPNSTAEYVLVNLITFGFISIICMLLGVVLVLQKVDSNSYKLRFSKRQTIVMVLLITIMNCCMVLALIDLYF